LCPSSHVGVCHEEQPLPDVRRADAVCAQHSLPDGVTLRFQVCRHMVEPPEPSRARNLLSKDDWRAALSDEPKPRRPEMTGIVEALAFAGAGEWLAGAASRPNRSVSGPACKLEREVPSGDASEPVAAREASEVSWLHVSDVPLIDKPGRDEPRGDESAQPLGGEGVVLVVVGIHTSLAAQSS
jgi:hypothetical protein